MLRPFNTAYVRGLRKCAGWCRGAGDRTTDAELRTELQVLGMPTLLRERLRYVARAARAGTPRLSALLPNAGGKTTIPAKIITEMRGADLYFSN